MRNTVYAYSLTGTQVIAHIKNENGSFEFEIDRQDFERALPRHGDMIDCSFTVHEDDEEKNVPLYLTLSEYWTQGEGVNDRGIIGHISQYIASNELVSLRLNKHVAMLRVMKALPAEHLQDFTDYNNAMHQYYLQSLKPAA